MKRLLAVILTLCLLLGTAPAIAAAGETTGTLEKRAGYDLATVPRYSVVRGRIRRP